jgi:putative Mg2+ transporter-C (MgtC) family protein
MIESIIRLLLATVLGAIVGLEREIMRKPAGLRTHMLVCLGSCLFTITSIVDFSVDPARIAAAIVTGMGFIGAGAIIAGQRKIVGVTTAASLWVTASIGLAVGVGNYVLSMSTATIVFTVLFLKKILRIEREIS